MDGRPADRRRRVVAIGLDAGELSLIERYVGAGDLPNIDGLLRRARLTDLHGPDYPELAWAEILTGCAATTLDYASPLVFTPDYGVRDQGAYDFTAIHPFYAYCHGRRVIVFDPPQARLAPAVEGVQILGWGSHSPLGPSVSDRPERLAEIGARFGRHPAFGDDWMLVPESAAKRDRLAAAYRLGIERRAQICLDLMRSPWDLLLVVFGEPHAAGHAMWHLSDANHPAAVLYGEPGRDPLREVYRTIDTAIGTILAATGDASVILFSSHGMKANSAELGSLVFLPELLYRRRFGKPALALGRIGEEPAPARRATGDWARTVWATQRDGSALRRLVRRRAPLGVSRRLDRLAVNSAGGGPALEHPYTSPLHYMPPLWYRPHWRHMQAFALPSFSDGFIRINLQGREAGGIVAASDYGALCADIAALVRRLKDARTGAPAVAAVTRSWASAEAALAAAFKPGEPEADLVVRWSEQPIDAVDSPRLGRIGPLPFRQGGGHTPRGFAALVDAAIPASRGAAGRVIDLAPTILGLLGVARSNHLQGRSLLHPALT